MVDNKKLDSLLTCLCIIFSESFCYFCQRIDCCIIDRERPLEGMIDNADKTEDDDELDGERQTAHVHGIVSFALVESLSLFLNLFLIALVFGVYSADLGLKALRLDGTLSLVDRSGNHKKSCEEGEEDECKTVIVNGFEYEPENISERDTQCRVNGVHYL